VPLTNVRNLAAKRTLTGSGRIKAAAQPSREYNGLMVSVVPLEFTLHISPLCYTAWKSRALRLETPVTSVINV